MQNHNSLKKDIYEIIITEEEIKKRIGEMGEEITASYKVGDDLIMACILRGAVIFMADLARCINMPVTFDFMDISSYGQKTESGMIRIIKDLDENIEGRHVLIVEDIIDTGKTIKHVLDMFATRDPASIKIATLLDKPERRVEKEVNVDFNGFEIPDKFVVGYGLDFAEKYRNLPYIGILKEELYN